MSMKKSFIAILSLCLMAVFLLAGLPSSSMASVNQSVVSVEDYGAIGNGIANDQPAIQQALDYVYSIGGGTVQFTPGKVYLISSILLVRDYTTIYARGATIKANADIELLHNQINSGPDAETPTGYSGHNHIVVDGGTWDCNAYDGTTGTNTGHNGISFTHCEDIVIKNLTILDNAVSHALELNACQHVKVLNCRFLGFSGSSNTKEAIQLDVANQGSGNEAWDGTMCNDIEISGCYCGPSERLPAPPVFVGSHSRYGTSFYTNVIVKDNVIDTNKAMVGYYWKDSIISGNIINNSGSNGITSTGCENLIITDNIVNGGGQPRIAMGTISLTPDAANVVKAVTVDLTPYGFTEKPCVFVNAQSSNAIGVHVNASLLSETGFTIYGVRENGTGGFAVNWIAIQY